MSNRRNRSLPHQAESQDNNFRHVEIENDNDDFSPPMSPEGYQELMARLTRQAAIIRRQYPLMGESLLPEMEPDQLVDEPMPSENESSPLERCQSGDTSLRLDETIGHVIFLCMDEAGSQYLVKELVDATAEDTDIVFEEIKEFASYLATHDFGHQVVQTMFHYGSEAQRSELIDMLIIDVDNLATHMYSRHVIQAALDVLDLDAKIKIARELEPYIARCASNHYGCDIILEIINCVPEELIRFFISALATDVVHLSTHPAAYRVIQRVLELASLESEERVAMITDILDAMHMLCYDEFGHHIVKKILDKAKSHECTAVAQRLSGYLQQMSTHPFASTVVEKSLVICRLKERRLLVNEILTIIETDHDFLHTMLNDKHGTEVFQKVVQASSCEQFGRLMSRLREYELSSSSRYRSLIRGCGVARSS